jgi:hypothetical protein
MSETPELNLAAALKAGLAAPFNVVSKADGRIASIEGFSDNDPLGVGGGAFPNMPTAYFAGGGWVLVDDLIKYWTLDPAALST